MCRSMLPPENTRPTQARHIRSGPLGVARFIVNLFSGTGQQREAPSSQKTLHIRLITIGVSHFCEKARWGLDLLESDVQSSIYYTEDAHPPAFVSFATIPVSNGQASQSPMITFKDFNSGESKTLYPSNVILRELCPFLYPSKIADGVVAIEADLGKRFGPTVRSFTYHHLLQPEFYDICPTLCAANTSKVEKFLFGMMLTKGIENGIRKIVQVNEETAQLSEEVIREVFSDLSEKLNQNGGEYLMDTKTEKYGFTAADLTFSALAYPLVRPPQMKNIIVLDDAAMPPTLVKLGDEMRATRAGQHALRMYADHRLGKDSDGLVVVKSIGRNRVAWRSLFYPAGALGITMAAVVLARQRSNL